MTPKAPDTSIVRRESPRPDLLVFDIRRKLTKNDIEWMSRVTDQAFDTYDQVDMLLIMSNYEGAELGAIFDGEAFGVQARAARHVRRYGVVGAPLWAEAMINLLSPLSPVEAKTFDLDEEQAAWRWVDGGAKA